MRTTIKTLQRSVAKAAEPSLRPGGLPTLSAEMRVLTKGLGAMQASSGPAFMQIRHYSSRFSRSLVANPTAEELRRAELSANAAPHDPHAQNVYLAALLEYGLPHEVIRRVTSGKFAVDAIILDHFCTAIARVRNMPEKELNELRVRLKEEWQAYGDDSNAYINPAVLQAAAGPALHMAAPVHAPSAAAAPSWMSGYGSTGPTMPSLAPRAVSSPAASSAFLASMPGTRQNPLVVEAFAGRRDFTSTIVRYVSIAGMFALVYYLLNNVVNKGVGGMGGGLSQLVGDSAEEVTEVPTTRFSDVKGADEAKQELEDVVAFLRDPEKYRRLGAKVPRGVLLTGPPGTGKTLLARAVAGEAGCKFYSKSASEFEEMLVGLGARRVRDLFNAARKSAPSIIFIDEIDALGGKRKVSVGAGAERQTLNQLLSSMDGFTKNENVIVIAATNSPEILDAALVRPGRFDTTVDVPLPDVKGRQEIIELYLTKVVVSKDIDPVLLAKATPGFSGAQIEAMINSAALMGANRGADEIEMVDMEEARDKVIMGPAKKGRLQKPETLKMTAYHEGGHTLAALLTKGANPLHKVTILPRGMSGGATWSLPSDEDYRTKENLLAEIDVCMGGRAAEELLYGPEKVTTGAGSDMQKATELARAIITRFSMSDLGLTSYSDKDPSPDKQALIDAEIEKLLRTSYTRVYNLLTVNKSQLDRLATSLVEYETLSAEECRDVIAGKALPPLKHKWSTSTARKNDKSGPRGPLKPADTGKKEPNPKAPKLGGVWSSVFGTPTTEKPTGAAKDVAADEDAADAPSSVPAAAGEQVPATGEHKPEKKRWV